MEKPESLVDEYLQQLYDKALNEGAAPVFTVDGKDWRELEETFPEPEGE